MPDALTGVLAALIGAAVTYAGSVIASVLESRRGIDDSIREKRMTAYADLWKETGTVPRWPRAEDLTYERLGTMSRNLRGWYYAGGGMYLSTEARNAYGEVQKMLVRLTSLPQHNGERPVEPLHYRDLCEACSALRSQLTFDLLSRSQALTVRGRRPA